MNYSFDKLDEESLRQLYSTHGLRCREIGSLVGVTEDAVFKLLRKYGIPTNPKSVGRSDVRVAYTGKKKGLRKLLTDDVLKGFCEQGLSDEEIGRRFGLTGPGVAYRRKRIGLLATDKFSKTRNASERLVSMSTDELRSMYHSMTNDAFSEKVGLSKTVWLPVLRQRGIGPKEDWRQGQYPALTKEQRFLIIGGLLGDGGIDRSPRYYETHSAKQKDYLRSKMVALEPYSNRIMKDHDRNEFRINTVTHPAFAEFREAFYTDGVPGKAVPLKFIEENWDDRILGYWFLDDGSYDDERRQMSIANFCGDRSQIERFVGWLEDRYGWGFSLSGHNVTVSKSHYRDFFRIVLGVATPDMYYKIPEDFLSAEEVARVSALVGDPRPKFYRLSPDPVKSAMEDTLFRRYWGKPFPYMSLSAKRAEYLASSFKRSSIIRDEGGVLAHSSAGMILCEGFFPNMYSASRKGHASPVDLWRDESFMRGYVRNRLEHADRVGEASMRRGFKAMRLCVSNFKPSVARFVFYRYGANGRVLDYSGGYGSRMLGAMSLGMDYVCVEPCSETASNLERFGSFLRPVVGGRFDVVKSGSEGFGPKPGAFSVAFSSPPYFDYERYSDESTQSVAKFPDYRRWIEGYWDPTVRNCIGSLAPGGVFSVCLSERSCAPLIEDTIRLCKSVGFHLFEKFAVPVRNFNGGAHEDILSFCSVDEAPPITWEPPDRHTQRPPRGVRRRRGRRVFRERYDLDGAVCWFKENAPSIGLARGNYEGHGINGVPAHVLERRFGSWNKFVESCGFKPGRVVKKPVDRIREYFDACDLAGDALGFGAYESATGNPASRMKRLFNAGKPYAHLKASLFAAARDKGLRDSFLGMFR